MSLEEFASTTCDAGDKLMRKAASVLSKKIHFGNKTKDAMKYYEQAAQIYMESNMYSSAGDAYCKSAECLVKSGEKHKAANVYNLASEAYLQDTMFDETKDTYNKAIDSLKKASLIYTENGQTAQAARKEKEIAERLSAESIVDVDILHLAIETYRSAAELFEFQQAYATANNCLEQIAHIYVRLKEYKESSKVWEEILNAEWNSGNSATGENSLIRHLETRYMFYASLTKIAGINDDYNEEDLELFWMDLEHFSDRGANFGKSREFDLIVGLYKAFKERDLKIFLRVVKKTLEVTKLDEWVKQLLLAIRKKLENCIHCTSVLEDEDGELDLT